MKNIVTEKMYCSVFYISTTSSLNAAALMSIGVRNVEEEVINYV